MWKCIHSLHRQEEGDEEERESGGDLRSASPNAAEKDILVSKELSMYIYDSPATLLTPLPLHYRICRNISRSFSTKL